MITNFLTKEQKQILYEFCKESMSNDNDKPMWYVKMLLDNNMRNFCLKNSYTRAYNFDGDWYVVDEFIRIKIFNAKNVCEVFTYDARNELRKDKIKSIL